MEPTHDPDEQQRRRGEVGTRQEREHEGEGQICGALEAELDKGKSQEVPNI